jgi:hypothetical protein
MNNVLLKFVKIPVEFKVYDFLKAYGQEKYLDTGQRVHIKVKILKPTIKLSCSKKKQNVFSTLGQ